MAFRLRSDESVAHGLRRLARKELEGARRELERTTPPSDDAVHEARKSLKKVRAIAQLVEADGGRRLGKGHELLRSVNDTLSRPRDADAMLSILEKLGSTNPRLLSQDTLGRLRRRLARHKHEVLEDATRRHEWKHVDRQLRALHKSA